MLTIMCHSAFDSTQPAIEALKEENAAFSLIHYKTGSGITRTDYCTYVLVNKSSTVMLEAFRRVVEIEEASDAGFDFVSFRAVGKIFSFHVRINGRMDIDDMEKFKNFLIEEGILKMEPMQSVA
jgi:hypothetical protein